MHLNKMKESGAYSRQLQVQFSTSVEESGFK